MLAHGDTFQIGIMFASEAVAHLKDYTLVVNLPANIRLGLKRLQGTNTLAYCEDLNIRKIQP